MKMETIAQIDKMNHLVKLHEAWFKPKKKIKIIITTRGKWR